MLFRPLSSVLYWFVDWFTLILLCVCQPSTPTFCASRAPTHDEHLLEAMPTTGSRKRVNIDFPNLLKDFIWNKIVGRYEEEKGDKKQKKMKTIFDFSLIVWG